MGDYFVTSFFLYSFFSIVVFCLWELLSFGIYSGMRKRVQLAPFIFLFIIGFLFLHLIPSGFWEQVLGGLLESLKGREGNPDDEAAGKELLGIASGVLTGLLAGFVGSQMNAEKRKNIKKLEAAPLLMMSHFVLVIKLKRAFEVAHASIPGNCECREKYCGKTWRFFKVFIKKRVLFLLKNFHEKKSHQSSSVTYHSYKRALKILIQYDDFLRVFATNAYSDNANRAYGVKALKKVMAQNFQLEDFFKSGEAYFNLSEEYADPDLYAEYLSMKKDILVFRNEIRDYIRSLPHPPKFHKDGNQNVKFLDRPYRNLHLER